jgi:diaminopimelate epimerase
VKAHACGNDFLVIDEADARGAHARLAMRLCSRHTSIGADGIEFIDRRPDGSAFLRLFNADGSEAELSGNGTRCVAAWLAASEGLREVRLGTHAGERSCRVVEGSGSHWLIETDMGVPRVSERRIRLTGSGLEVAGAVVNIGNPHFVIFTEAEDFSSHGLSWQALGAQISVDPLFRFGTNVEFVRVLGPGHIAFRIFERGCGPTTSSGTGTCASSTAAIALKGVHHELTAIAEGGQQTVRWASERDSMWLTGPAQIVCQGVASRD